MIYEFNAMSGGDGECFCFFVDKETYIKICGEEEYAFELAHLKSWHEEVYSEPGSEPFTEPTEWPIYPNKFFKSSTNLKIKIEVEELPTEVI